MRDYGDYVPGSVPTHEEQGVRALSLLCVVAQEIDELRDHSAATHLGDQKVPLQLIMGKTRHKSPRSVTPTPRPRGCLMSAVTVQPRRCTG